MAEAQMMNLIPLHDKVLVKPRKKRAYEKSGLVIPQTANVYERPEEGYVIAVNKGYSNTEEVDEKVESLLADLKKMTFVNVLLKEAFITILSALKVKNLIPDKAVVPSFKEGDLVFFTKHVGFKMEIEGESYLVLGENQIVGKIPWEKLSAEEQDEYAHGPKEQAS